MSKAKSPWLDCPECGVPVIEALGKWLEQEAANEQAY